MGNAVWEECRRYYGYSEWSTFLAALPYRLTHSAMCKYEREREERQYLTAFYTPRSKS